MITRLPGILKTLCFSIIAVAVILYALVATNTKAGSYLYAAPSMLTGMGAKLSCSGRYVSGLTGAQAQQDLTSYSPILSLVQLAFDDQQQIVEASLFGGFVTQARYRSGIGCSLEIGDTSLLDAVQMPVVTETDEAWPAGAGTPHNDAIIQQHLESILARDNQQGYNTRALAVVKGGKLVAEAYGEGFDSRSRLLGWSMAKSVTAMLVGRLEEQGRLSVGDRGLFHGWAEDERRDITIEHLLTMSSGLDFSEDYNPGEDATNMLFRAHSASDYAVMSPLKHGPGEFWSYSSGTTNLLSRVIHKSQGDSVQATLDFLVEDFFAPLGMADSVFELDSSGVMVGSSYLYASARDWARIGQLMLDGGQLNNRRLLSRDWVRRARRTNSSANDPRYGYQFWLNDGGEALRWPDLPRDSYAALGNRKQVVMVVPSEGAVLVRLGWTQGDYPTNENFSELLSILKDRHALKARERHTMMVRGPQE